jgi:hypothetical protein
LSSGWLLMYQREARELSWESDLSPGARLLDS